jgi:hypothetical protein
VSAPFPVAATIFPRAVTCRAPLLLLLVVLPVPSVRCW